MVRRQQILAGVLVGGIVAAGLASRWLVTGDRSMPSQELMVGVLILGVVGMAIIGVGLVFPAVRRVMFVATSLLSILLLLATIAEWARSYGLFTNAVWQEYDATTHESKELTFASGWGVARVSVHAVTSDRSFERISLGWNVLSIPAAGFRTPGSFMISGTSMLNRMGFSWDLLESPSGAYIWQASVPWWFLAVIFLVLPVWRGTLMIRHSRRKRREARLGLCKKCGYDLRAHGPGQKCPECGTPIVSPS